MLACVRARHVRGREKVIASSIKLVINRSKEWAIQCANTNRITFQALMACTSLNNAQVAACLWALAHCGFIASPEWIATVPAQLLSAWEASQLQQHQPNSQQHSQQHNSQKEQPNSRQQQPNSQQQQQNQSTQALHHTADLEAKEAAMLMWACECWGMSTAVAQAAARVSVASLKVHNARALKVRNAQEERGSEDSTSSDASGVTEHSNASSDVSSIAFALSALARSSIHSNNHISSNNNSSSSSLHSGSVNSRGISQPQEQQQSVVRERRRMAETLLNRAGRDVRRMGAKDLVQVSVCDSVCA